MFTLAISTIDIHKHSQTLFISTINTHKPWVNLPQTSINRSYQKHPSTQATSTIDIHKHSRTLFLFTIDIHKHSIYIYIYTHIHIFIYIYIYTHIYIVFGDMFTNFAFQTGPGSLLSRINGPASVAPILHTSLSRCGT